MRPLGRSEPRTRFRHCGAARLHGDRYTGEGTGGPPVACHQAVEMDLSEVETLHARRLANSRRSSTIASTSCTSTDATDRSQSQRSSKPGSCETITPGTATSVMLEGQPSVVRN